MSDPNVTMQADEVLTFLDNHPDFLQQHADRFALKPPNNDRVVVSLIDRQMLELKDRCRQLEARLQQLVEHGENNDRTQKRMHQLALTLLSTDSPIHLNDSLRASFAEVFSIERMALRLWHPAVHAITEIFTTRKEISLLASSLSNPYCGPYVNDEVMSWFPAVPVLQSFSQIALRQPTGEAFGLLVLASDDPQRFTHDMHTHYLMQLGELVSAAWRRLVD